MASKKQQTVDALNKKPKGWANQFGDAPAPRPEGTRKEKGKLTRKTYLLTDDLISRLEDTAKANKVGVNELVRYLVKHGLDALDAKEYSLPVRVVTTYTLDV
jgi:hypothetical protein